MRRGDAYLVMHELITCVVGPAETGARLLVLEAAVPPQGGPPPLHRHPPDELFHAIEGHITLFRASEHGTERIELAPGATSLVPGGTAHTFRNLTSAPARLLLAFTPGPMMAAFFTQAGRPAADGPAPDPAAEVERVLGVGARLGLETLELVPA